MLRKVRKALATQRPVRRYIALAVGGGLLIFFVWSALRVETVEHKLRRLEQEFQTEDSWWRRKSVALWQALPSAVQGVLPSGLAPQTIEGLKFDALSELRELGPKATPCLTAMLDNPGDHAFALSAIGSLGLDAQAATPRLLRALESSLDGTATKTWNRVELPFVVQALGAVAPPDPPVVERLIEFCSDRWGEDIGTSAADAIVRLASRSRHGVEILEKALQHPGPWRSRLVEGFAGCHDKTERILAALTHQLEIGDKNIQLSATRALGQLGPRAAPAVPTLIDLLRTQRGKPLDEGQFSPRRQAMLLRYALVYSSPIGSLRGELIRALSRISPAAPETVSALAEEYQDVQHTLRFELAVDRWRMGAAVREILPVFTEGFAAPDPKVRLLALHAWAPSVPSLPDIRSLFIQALSDSALEVRLAALEACAPLVPSEPEIRSRFAKTLSDPAAEVRAAAIQAWGPLVASTPELTPDLTNALADPALEVRLAAFRACAPLAPSKPEIIPLLTKALSDPEFKVRQAALEGCERLVPSAPEIIPSLTDALSDSHGSIRRLAARLLGGFRSNAFSAVPALTRLLTDTNYLVRAEATNALAAIQKDQRAIPPPRTSSR
jgi:HEAT repeat protein